MNPLHFHVNERVTAEAKPKGICDDHRYAAQICAWHGSDTLCDKETVSVLFQRASQRALGESGWHNNNVHHQSKTNACTLGPLPWTALRTTHSCRYQCVILIKRETLEVISGKVLFPPHWLTISNYSCQLISHSIFHYLLTECAALCNRWITFIEAVRNIGNQQTQKPVTIADMKQSLGHIHDRQERRQL